jgi:hypothetical protein
MAPLSFYAILKISCVIHYCPLIASFYIIIPNILKRWRHFLRNFKNPLSNRHPPKETALKKSTPKIQAHLTNPQKNSQLQK